VATETVSHVGQVFAGHYDNDVLALKVPGVGETRQRAWLVVTRSIQGVAGSRVHGAAVVPVRGAGTADQDSCAEVGVAGNQLAGDDLGHGRATDVSRADKADRYRGYHEGSLTRETFMATKPTKQQRWYIAAGVVGVLLIWFAVANASSVPIHFWFTTRRAPLIIVIVVSAFLGAAVGALVRRARK